MRHAMRRLLSHGGWSVIWVIAGVVLLVTVILPIVWAVIVALTWWVFGVSLLVSGFIFSRRR